VVNGRFARKFFPGENPVGKHFGQVSLRHAGDYEIVGLADDLQYVSPTSAMHAMFYLPESEHVEFERPKDIVVEEHSRYLGTLEIRARGNIVGLEENTRRVLRQINPGLAVIEFHSLDSQVSEQFGRDVMVTTVVGFFGCLSLILSVLGLYCITAFVIQNRIREIGIRFALGARRRDIVRLVAFGALRPLCIGVSAGLFGSIVAGKLLASYLFKVSPADPLVLISSIGALVLFGTVAALWPAWKAARLDPCRLLRIN
jgi:predicted lysophospholipase L1 biosynthesis ABC-type transport system permease subunit